MGMVKRDAEAKDREVVAAEAQKEAAREMAKARAQSEAASAAEALAKNISEEANRQTEAAKRGALEKVAAAAARERAEQEAASYLKELKHAKNTELRLFALVICLCLVCFAVAGMMYAELAERSPEGYKKMRDRGERPDWAPNLGHEQP